MTTTANKTPSSLQATNGSAPSLPTSVSVPPTELQAKAEWLVKMLDYSIGNVGQKRLKNQYRASSIKLTMIILSGVATILLGLQIVGFEPIFNNVAFVLTSIVTLLTAIEPFFNYRALWVEHELAKAQFHRLKDEVEFYMAGTTPDSLRALQELPG